MMDRSGVSSQCRLLAALLGCGFCMACGDGGPSLPPGGPFQGYRLPSSFDPERSGWTDAQVAALYHRPGGGSGGSRPPSYLYVGSFTQNELSCYGVATGEAHAPLVSFDPWGSDARDLLDCTGQFFPMDGKYDEQSGLSRILLDGRPTGEPFLLFAEAYIGERRDAAYAVGHVGPLTLPEGWRHRAPLALYPTVVTGDLDGNTRLTRFWNPVALRRCSGEGARSYRAPPDVLLTTAVRLHDGRVLVAGGFRVQGESDCPWWAARGWRCFELLATDEAWLFDATSACFFAPRAGALRRARGGHTATVLPDGRVLVAGGASRALLLASGDRSQSSYHLWVMPMDADGATLLSFELFDPMADADPTDPWRDGDPARGGFVYEGVLAAPRFLHGAALTSIPRAGGQEVVQGVLLAGGTEAPSSWEFVDPARPGGPGPRQTGRLRFARFMPTVVSARGAGVWILGGAPPTREGAILERWLPEEAAMGLDATHTFDELFGEQLEVMRQSERLPRLAAFRPPAVVTVRRDEAMGDVPLLFVAASARLLCRQTDTGGGAPQLGWFPDLEPASSETTLQGWLAQLSERWDEFVFCPPDAASRNASFAITWGGEPNPKLWWAEGALANDDVRSFVTAVALDDTRIALIGGIGGPDRTGLGSGVLVLFGPGYRGWSPQRFDALRGSDPNRVFPFPLQLCDPAGGWVLGPFAAAAPLTGAGLLVVGGLCIHASELRFTVPTHAAVAYMPRKDSQQGRGATCRAMCESP